MSEAFDGPVFVADQRLWPRGDMPAQADDVAEVARIAQDRYPGRKSLLVAHSSGAHSAAIALADGSTTVDVVVLQARVYDPSHTTGTRARALQTVSPMEATVGAEEDVRRHEGTHGVETVSPMVPAGDAAEDELLFGDYAFHKFFQKK